MASTQQIKRRIGTVKNTKQITKAMELVAASKMRKAQEATMRSRSYRNTAREILTRINEITDVSEHPLYAQRDVKNRLYILVTSDRGLAGAYNANVLKLFTARLKEDVTNDITSKAILIGRQSAQFASKLDGLEVVGVYENFPENPSANDLKPIIETATGMFTGIGDEDSERELDDLKSDGQTVTTHYQADDVVVVYTDFISSITQEAKTQSLLPAAFEPAESHGDLDDVPLEPSPVAVLETITPRLVEVQLFQAILESQASEHIARMMAMKSASDNASDLIDDLTLAYNSARQAAITQELAEITGGSEAIA